MGSWVNCPCGRRLHKNLFTGTGVQVVVPDAVLDAFPEDADSGDCVSEIIAKGEILVRCSHCGRIAIEDRQGNLTIYRREM